MGLSEGVKGSQRIGSNAKFYNQEESPPVLDSVQLRWDTFSNLCVHALGSFRSKKEHK